MEGRDVTDLERRQPILIGDVIGSAPREALVEVVTKDGDPIRIPDRECTDCPHPASRHRYLIPGPDSAGYLVGACRDCLCALGVLEAAGWTPPGSCAMGCR